MQQASNGVTILTKFTLSGSELANYWRVVSVDNDPVAFQRTHCDPVGCVVICTYLLVIYGQHGTETRGVAIQDLGLNPAVDFLCTKKVAMVPTLLLIA